MFSKVRSPHKRSSSTVSTPNATNDNVNPTTRGDAPLVSPIQMTFDFELPIADPISPSPFSPVSDYDSRPKTSHGLPVDGHNAGRLGGDVNVHRTLQPPFLPPIPRVASTINSIRSSNSNETSEQQAGREGVRARGDSDNASVVSKRSALKARLSFEHPVDMLPSLSRPTTPLNGRPQTAAGESSTLMPLKMESSLFPPKQQSAAMQPASNTPLMSRHFIDSRDKPYSQPPRRPMLHANHSSPDVLRPQSSATVARTPPTPLYSSNRDWISSQSSTQNLGPRTDLSGSTARPSTHASTATAHSASRSTTIGTPYQSTADSFPLPQLVKTRPKTTGATATVAGVSVPTHHTSRPRANDKPVETKKKGRLLNPLSLLQRRRSGQDPVLVAEERSNRHAQAQALARQRDVAASGVNKPPPDFDPRIKGRVVHDFSAPRSKRNTFSELDISLSPSGLPSADSSPAFSPSGFPPRNTSLSNRDHSDESVQRRSMHTPVFVEHLSDDPEVSQWTSSVQAEQLENKNFLQRASKQSTLSALSQESAVLPPFARRSQTLDPAQASFYQDDESKRSSDPSSGKERDSTLSSVGDVSPVTARSSSQLVGLRSSMSPVSPTTPNGKGFRPISDVSEVHRASFEPIQNSSPEKQGQNRIDSKPRPYSLVPAACATNTIAERSNDNSPIARSPQPGPSQEPLLLARGVSIRQESSSNESLELPEVPKTHTPDAQSDSPATRSLIERTAGIATPEHTPEPELVESVQFRRSRDQPKLVEKRASAVSHSGKSSSGPKHHTSNASRFSFQFASESAAQEQALEEKHRKIRIGQLATTVQRGQSPDLEEDDDYFDEDAMDDMDEIELQGAHLSGAEQQTPPSQSSTYLQHARQMLKEPDSDDGSLYDEDNIPDITNEADVPYPDHPAFRAHSALGSHSRQNSYQTAEYWRGSALDEYMRDSDFSRNHSRMQSQASDLEVGVGSQAARNMVAESQDDSVAPLRGSGGADPNSRSRPNFYMQPQAAGYPSAVSLKATKPPLPQRSSGNSEQNRVISGMSFGSLVTRSEPPPTVDAQPTNLGREHVGIVLNHSDQGLLDNEPIRRSPHHSPDPIAQPTDLTTRIASGAVSQQSASTSSNGRVPSKALEGSPLAVTTAKADPIGPEAGGMHQRSLNRMSHMSPVQGPISHEDLYQDNSAVNTSLASDPKSSPYSDSKGNESVDAFSFTSSPPKGALIRGSRDSDRSFEEYVNDDSFRAHGTTTSGREVDQNGRPTASSLAGTPLVSGSHNQHALANNARETNSAWTPFTGLGLDMFAGFDFGQDGSASVVKSTDQPRNESVRNSVPTIAAIEGEKALSASHSRWGELQSLSSSLAHERSPSTSAGKQPASDGPQAMRPGQPHNASMVDDDDDMYFDDGHFDHDISESHSKTFDEDVFDDDQFLARPGMVQPLNHRRDRSSAALSGMSLGSDGPYPTFAMPNASRASQRYSQMMLEDLPLQAPVDSRYIPQRNPSEDAKRLGMSDKVPPVPVPESNREAFTRMQANLQTYHAALAQAATKAATEGRFLRAPSVSTTASTARGIGDAKSLQPGDDHSFRDDKSTYSNGEDGGDIPMPYSDGNSSLKISRNDTTASHLSHLTTYSPPRMDFDFGFGQAPDDDSMDDFGNDDDLVAAANAEALASDDEGFYGQEFDFYGRPRANSGDLEAVNGGFFGENGDDGLTRNKSLKEPNLTPITERSEFSTRNSFIGFGHGPSSAGPWSPNSPAVARLPVSPLVDGDVTTLDELRRLRANAFAGSNASSLRSNSNRSSAQSLQAAFSPTTLNTRANAAGQSYFAGGAPMQYAYSTDSSNSSNQNGSSHLVINPGFNFIQDNSPHSAGSSQGMPFSMQVDIDATPRKNSLPLVEPVTARKALPTPATGSSAVSSHSRKGSQADSVTYVREKDPQGGGKPRWVLERRRTSEQGQLELIGRELVQGGWI